MAITRVYIKAICSECGKVNWVSYTEFGMICSECEKLWKDKDFQEAMMEVNIIAPGV